MDFAPYQSSPPEHSRPFSPPLDGAAAAGSPRASFDNFRRSFSPPQHQHQQQYQQPWAASPPPLQHPQPQRSWQSPLPGYAPPEGAAFGGPLAGAGIGASAGAGAGPGAGGYRDGVSEFDTSLGIRLDYEACLAYLALPPVGAILLLILERQSDFVRFHAWQSSLLFTAAFVVHLVFSFSPFLWWVIFLGELGLIGWLVMRTYRDADTLDRFEVPVFGQIASRILDDE